MTSTNVNGSIADLAAALAKAQGEFQPASKNSTNPFHKSKYADLASVVDSAREILTKHGLSVTQLPKNVPELGWVLETVLLHASGQSISCQLPLIMDKQTNQCMGASMTYMRRYGFCAITGVVVDEDDDDGETADGRGKSKPQYQGNQGQLKPAIPTAPPVGPMSQAPATPPTAAAQEGKINETQLAYIVQGMKLIDQKTLENYHKYMVTQWNVEPGDYKNLPVRAYNPTLTMINNNLNQQPQQKAV